jgi:ketosteroid isomerase-like protein
MRGMRTTWFVVTAAIVGVTAQQLVTADESEALQQSLEAAELSFAASVAQKDWTTFRDHIAEEAIFVGGPVLNGKTAILESWASFFADDAPKLVWHPEIVAVQRNGTLGISKGPYTLTIPNENGEVSTQKGQFNSIWEYREHKGWKIIFDSGCSPCPDCSSQ